MDLKELGTSLLKYSPLVAGAIAGPAGSMVAGLLASMFGVTTADLSKAVITDPEASLKIKQFEFQHSEELAKIDAGNYAIDAADRKNARENNTEHSRYEWVVHVLATMVTIGFFSAITLVMLTRADSSDHDILDMMLGVLGSTWVSVMSYYFGSIKK